MIEPKRLNGKVIAKLRTIKIRIIFVRYNSFGVIVESKKYSTFKYKAPPARSARRPIQQ